MTTTAEMNKALVLEAFDTLFNKRDYEAAKRCTVIPAIGRTRLGQRTTSKVRVFVWDPIRAEH
jgi:hypothetical protein